MVTVLNEEGAVDELHRRLVAALDGRDWEAIFVDDGSTDEHVREAARAARGRPARARVRFKRNFGQHPAMHAGLSRARGDLIVTMDGDLQNEPEDIPKLLDALDARRRRVGTAHRAARLARAHGAEPRDQRPAPPLHRRRRSPTSAARSTATAASAIEPMLGVDRAAEVHEGARALERASPSRRSTSRTRRRSPARATRRSASSASRCTSSRASGRSRCSGSASRSASSARSRRRRSGSTASPTGSSNSNFPGPLFAGAGIVLVLGIQGFVLALIGESLGRIQRDVEGRPLYTIEEELS